MRTEMNNHQAEVKASMNNHQAEVKASLEAMFKMIAAISEKNS
jgi:hypothetical protein